VAAADVPRYKRRMRYMLPKVEERECPACKGAGFAAVKQPAEPGRRIYPPQCDRCGGKGRVEAAN
jgi:DnaJ-class molecular chaperone